jgi:hypothetical protein
MGVIKNLEIANPRGKVNIQTAYLQVLSDPNNKTHPLYKLHEMIRNPPPIDLFEEPDTELLKVAIIDSDFLKYILYEKPHDDLLNPDTIRTLENHLFISDIIDYMKALIMGFYIKAEPSSRPL